MRNTEDTLSTRARRLVVSVIRRGVRRRPDADGALRGAAQRWPADVEMEHGGGSKRCRIDLCVRSALGAATCDDVAFAIDAGSSLIVGVSDGAGIQGGTAARLVAEWFTAVAKRGLIPELEALAREMSVLDNDITSLDGATTAVVGQIRDGELLLVSAGDSEAWVTTGDGLAELTRGQPKRRLGDGIGAPLAVGPLPLVGPVIIASDGLLRRVGPEAAFEIVDGCRSRPVLALVEAVQAKCGCLPDDVAVLVIEPGGNGVRQPIGE